MINTLDQARAAFDTARERERKGHFVEMSAMTALLEMYTAQRSGVKLPAATETSRQTYTDAELVRAMRNYNDDIRAVAAFLNVSKGSIYNRLRLLPPGMIDGADSRKPGTYAPRE